MRDIKFRGKRIDNGEWICGYLTLDSIGNSIISIWESKGMVDTLYKKQVDPETVEIMTDSGEYKNIKEVKIG